MAEASNGSGMRVIIFISAAAAVIGIMFAFTEPMNQRIGVLENTLSELRGEHKTDIEKSNEADIKSAEDRSAINANMSGIESRINILENHYMKQDDDTDCKLGELAERITFLEAKQGIKNDSCINN